MQELAIEKLKKEKKAASYDKYAAIMKDRTCDALMEFCRQDAEFAQAVYQGGSFEDCMKAVAKNCGSGISDLEAFRRAVQFYFQGADIQFCMTINLCAGVEEPEQVVQRERPSATKAHEAPAAEEKKGAISLDLSDFM